MSVGVALTGGADYHMASVVVLLILQLYVVFGFPSLRADLAANACPTSEASPAVAGCLAVGASSEAARVRPLYLRADAHLGSERTVLATPVLGTPLDELWA